MISKKCKYALKALTYIAKHQEDKPIFSTEIAREERIPHKFLESILRALKNNQILLSKRGKNGGYKLLKQPEEIVLTDLIRIMDGPIALSPCVSLNYYESCDECDEDTCTIRPVLEKIRDLTLDVFNKTTIENLK
jgi:Rrf2 family protein